MTTTVLYSLLISLTAMSAFLALYWALPRAGGQRALRWLLAGLLVSPVANAVPAIFQCELDGRTSYQDTPCELEAMTIRVMPILKPPPESIPVVPAVVATPPVSAVTPVAGQPAAAPPAEAEPASVRRGADAPTLPEAKPRIERIEQTQFNRDKRSAEVRKASAECQGILDQIAAQKGLLHSLRAESRTQARSKVDALARDLRARC